MGRRGFGEVESRRMYEDDCSDGSVTGPVAAVTGRALEVEGQVLSPPVL